jgi:hypothetical protein
MEKICLLDENKKCTNCKECDKCDLNPEKICNNCGKCLDLEGYAHKEVIIDKILENPDEIEEYEESLEEEEIDENAAEEFLNDYDDDYVRDEKDELPYELELIDDIDGLSELLEDEEKRKRIIEEKSPGIFVIKKTDN